MGMYWSGLSGGYWVWEERLVGMWVVSNESSVSGTAVVLYGECLVEKSETYHCFLGWLTLKAVSRSLLGLFAVLAPRYLSHSPHPTALVEVKLEASKAAQRASFCGRKYHRNSEAFHYTEKQCLHRVYRLHGMISDR